MPRKKYKKYSLEEALKRIHQAGIKKAKTRAVLSDLDSLETRIEKILDIYNKHGKKAEKMIYLIMYDIENDKIRTQIAKYLIDRGCVRIQKSVYIHESDRKMFDEIYQTLKEVQSYYDNQDSIFFIPVSTDEIKSMKIVGQSIDFSIFIDPPSTIFI